MQERGTQQHSFLESLGDGRWFGYGRRFGIQNGPFEQRIGDPFTKPSSIIERFWGFTVQGGHVSDEQIETFTNTLIENVNAGNIDPNLVPTLEKKVVNLSNPLSQSGFYSYIERQNSTLRLYHRLISSANTLQSVPFLLQVLDSSFIIREDKPSETSRKLVEEKTEERWEHREKHLREEWYEVYEVVERKYEKKFKFAFKGKPLAELARGELEAIISEATDPALQIKVRDNIANMKPPKQKHFVTVQRDIETGPERYIGWRS